MERRSFLALGLGALAWACGRGGNGPDDGSAGDEPVNIIVTAQQGLAVGDTRQGFAFLRGQKLFAPKDISVELIRPGGGDPFDVEVEHVEVERGLGGDSSEQTNTDVEDIYVFRHDFDQPGIWDMVIRFDGERKQAVFTVVEDQRAPIVGKKAIASKSPTKQDPRGVDPICTRSPKCSMHDVSIAEAVSSGKPSVLIFGTAAFCTTRTCGPVIDYVEAAAKEYGDEASFVHIEEWRNDKDAVNQPDGLAPAFAEWKLESEPWLYFIGRDGVVKDRWLGAMGKNEVRRAVKAHVET